ncbi:MAG: patatin-like phospholipase family protein, partial [Gammaproteobacteria bacterium]
MTRQRWLVLAFGLLTLGGCVSVPRRPPPPGLINAAEPAGFGPDIRLLTVDRRRYIQEFPQWVAGLRKAAHGKPINILVLSGGGSYGAFGAGALTGLSKTHARPQFQLVTGVSAGALLAPFAFLGPSWDDPLRKVFTSGALRSLQRSSKLGALKRIVFPQGVGGHDPLATLVNRFVSDDMIDAVARQAATGRQLWVATTNLDDQETEFWNMGAIAERGGAAAHKLFRKVLIASASIPGMFPPVMIRVAENGKTYDEMHVDGSVTTPLFLAPVVALTAPVGHQLAGANVYVMINGHMGKQPTETPINTIRILEDSFSAQLIYNTRNAFNEVIAFAYREQMHLDFTSIPDAFRSGSFLDFHRQHLQELFDYGESCAMRGLLWTTVAQDVERNAYQQPDDRSARMCPDGV